MRIRRIAIDGYGRIMNTALNLEPGLQIIMGPNEHGKTTIRCFVSDMLYGQKRSLSQRLYDETNELRRPWTNPETYGGRLVYQLDNGREIEVSRQFDRKNEVVQVFDRTHGHDITATFEQYRNREPNFAQTHIGLSKEVFINTATIAHMTLEGLGDEDALAQIREKLLSLADTGEENHSADAALKRLEARIAAIGQPAARTRPLPAARARLVELEREKEQARTLRRELEQLETQRRGLLDEIAEIQRQLAGVDQDLETLDRVERAQRLREAERIEAQISEVTPKAFALRDAASFPLEQRHDFQRAEMLLATARNTLERLKQEQTTRQEQVQVELGQLPRGVVEENEDVPDDFDRQLTANEEKVRGLHARLDEAESARAAAEKRLAAAEQELASLPDYNRLADDPMTWLNQLANSFEVAQRVRDEECEKWRVLKERLRKQQELLTIPDALFKRLPEFENAARDYEVQARMREEQVTQLDNKADELQATVDDLTHTLPELTLLTLLCAVLTAGLVVVAALVNWAVIVAGALAGLTTVYFTVKLLSTRGYRRASQRQLDEAEEKVTQIRTTEDAQSKAIEELMVEAGCQSVRELEAKFDNYRKDYAEFESLERAGVEIEAKATQTQQRVSQLFEHYCKTFETLGIPLADEKEVAEAAGRANARYQSYRDAKRRIAENREQIKRHETDIARIQADLDACRKQDVELGLAVRQMMRDRGYPDESKHENVLNALRSYRIRSAQAREKRRVLQQNIENLNANVEAEERNVREYTQLVSRFLTGARVETAEQWHARAKQAEEYRQVRQTLDSLNQHKAAVLRGQDLRELRATVEMAGAEAPPPGRNAQELRSERENLVRDLGAHMKDERALYGTLTERNAGMRALNEIEEELTATAQRARDLEFELSAASHAMALVEEIARDKHARIAPRIAARAGGYLKEITAGAYTELFVDRELRLSVRIPQIQRLQQDPERVLSKGTVDQVYLALRLAVVQCITETGESIPMLLDDPFPNYDDDRLERAMGLLARIAKENQVMLFTCRDDVVRAAQAVNAPILRI